MPWIPRGLRNGIVTSKYPRLKDDYGPGFHGAIEVNRQLAQHIPLEVLSACPTKAIEGDETGVRVDRGRCVLCGNCVRMLPRVFQFSSNVELSSLRRTSLVVPRREESEQELKELRDALSRRVRSLRRSVHVRHLDSGSDGSDEWEVAALTNPVYDVQRLGIYFTASPRHADVLLVTGAGSFGMVDSLKHTFEVMPSPKIVIAAGTDAISGGVFGGGYATGNGVVSVVDVDVYIPGSPATPFGLLHGLLMAIDLLPERKPRGQAK